MKIRRVLFCAFAMQFMALGTLLADRYQCESSAGVAVTPMEDLMSEHGGLNRVMLIYENIIKRIDNGQDFPAEALRKAAEVIQVWIEGHHEKLEEQYIFPLLEKNNVLVEDVKTLREQHAKGRELTAYIIAHARTRNLKTAKEKEELKKVLVSFITMYRPHEAREDTVIFPTFLSLLSEEEYLELKELFEEAEHKHFGGDPLDKFIAVLEEIEKQLGIYDLNTFTPNV